MGKYVIGFGLGCVLAIGIPVLAKQIVVETPLSVVDTLDIEHVAKIYKIYDENNGASCYLTETYANTFLPTTISCLK